MLLGNGTTTYGYDTQSALASLAHNLAGSAQDLTFSYTRNQAREIADHGWNNDLYQWTGYANGTKGYSVNGLNQYTLAAGATLGYDSRGNLTDDGADLVAEYNHRGPLLRSYVHGPGVDEPLVWYEGSSTTSKTWLYADHLGSVVGTADSAGSSTAVHSYGPYGEPDVSTGVRFRYTGLQYLGGLNLYYYKARFYSPALGRFLQTDPIGTADDLNLYAYVGNDPINFSDPSGLSGAEFSILKGTFGDDGEQQTQQQEGNCSLCRVFERNMFGGVTDSDYTATLVVAPIPIVKAGLFTRAGAWLKNTFGFASRTTVRFGNNANQVSHAFRHTDTF